MNDSYSLYTDSLNGEYREAFGKIEMYVFTMQVSQARREEQLSELLDIFLIAQSEGKPVRKITGDNLERFCKAFCSGYGAKNRILDTLDALKSIAWTLFVIAAIDMLFVVWDYFDGVQVDIWSSGGSLNFPAYMVGLAVAILCGVATNLIIRRIMFRIKRISMTVLQIIDLSVVLFAAFLIVWFIGMNSENFPNCPGWTVMLVCAVYLIGYYILNRRRLLEKKRSKVKFRYAVAAESEKQLAPMMKKKFQKANERNIKKGEGVLSAADFLEKEEKDCKRVEKSAWFYYTLPIVITAAGFIFQYINGGFESVADGIVFICVLFAVEYPLMIFLWRTAKTGAAERRAWIESKRKQLLAGIDIFESGK